MIRGRVGKLDKALVEIAVRVRHGEKWKAEVEKMMMIEGGSIRALMNLAIVKKSISESVA
jgi:hypothetical protein